MITRCTDPCVRCLDVTADPSDSVMPTMGFDSDTLVHRHFNVRVFGIGGGKNLRGIWSHYYDEVCGYSLDTVSYAQSAQCWALLAGARCGFRG